MKQSKLFSKTLRNTPRDIEDKSSALLTRAGYILKLSAGITNFLPLGQRVIKKIIDIIEGEMDAIGGQQISLPTLQPKALWEKTGRWTTMSEEMYRLKDRRDSEFSLGMTHEEVATYTASMVINSYQDLPLAVYQIKDKFRDEPRAKAGLMRQREFIMKDMYSFHTTEEDFNQFYDNVAKSYLNIFKKVGLENVYQVKAVSEEFTTLKNHEFQLESQIGEDKIFIHENKEPKIAKSAEETDKLIQDGYKSINTIELGHIFSLGTKYSKSFKAQFTDKEGKLTDITMGCYGIGVGRLMATVAEKFSDDKGLVWPKAVAPFDYHLIDLTTDGSGEKVYTKLVEAGKEVLFDDRKISAGEKFADADLIGIPVRLVVSTKTGDKIEYKERNSQETKLISVEELF